MSQENEQEPKIEIQETKDKKRPLSPESKKKSSKNKKPRVSKTEWMSEDNMTNALFEKFYQTQEIMEKEEWKPFIESLKETLPITFRINTTNEEAGKKLVEMFLQKSKDFEKFEIDGKKIPPPSVLPWYPEENCGWHFEVTKGDLRKNPALQNYKLLLQTEHEQGGITRQEAVLLTFLTLQRSACFLRCLWTFNHTTKFLTCRRFFELKRFLGVRFKELTRRCCSRFKNLSIVGNASQKLSSR
jgi:hypothetical protein